MEVGDSVWLAHPGDPGGPARAARIVDDKGPFDPGRGSSVQMLRVRFADGQELILPSFKLAALPPALAGAWRLTDWEERDGQGTWSSPLGEGAAGLLLCHPSGAISFQLTAPAAHVPYAGLFGRAAVRDAVEGDDGVRGALLVHVEGVHPPGFSDDGQPRPFHLDGDLLALGDGERWRRSLTRIPG